MYMYVCTEAVCQQPTPESSKSITLQEHHDAAKSIALQQEHHVARASRCSKYTRALCQHFSAARCI